MTIKNFTALLNSEAVKENNFLLQKSFLCKENCMTEEEFKKFKEDLKVIFRGYKKINASMEKRLREKGFEIVRHKSHYMMKLVVRDKVFFFEVASTPSDSRSGIKKVKDISRIMRASGIILAA